MRAWGRVSLGSGIVEEGPVGEGFVREWYRRGGATKRDRRLTSARAHVCRSWSHRASPGRDRSREALL